MVDQLLHAGSHFCLFPPFTARFETISSPTQASIIKHITEVLVNSPKAIFMSWATWEFHKAIVDSQVVPNRTVPLFVGAVI